MQQIDLSRSFTVQSRAHAQVFGNAFKRRIVLSCVREAKSISRVADELAIPIKKIHYHMTSLAQLGLLHVVAERPRNGRPIKLYQAIADSFFIPRSLMEDANRSLRKALYSALDEARIRAGGGTYLSVQDDGSMRMQPIKSDPTQAFGATEAWMTLHLSQEAAQRLQADIMAVIKDSIDKPQTSAGQPVLVHFAVAPHKID